MYRKNLVMTLRFYLALLFVVAIPTASVADMPQLLHLGAVVSSKREPQITGVLTLADQGRNEFTVRGSFSGLTPGAHDFYIHEMGDCSADDFSSAGGRYALTNTATSTLGSIVADAQGNSKVDLVSSRVSLAALVGRSVIVYEKAAKQGAEHGGDSGARVACGVIK